MQSAGVGKVRSVAPHFGGLLIHQLHKRLLRAGNFQRKAGGSVGARGQNRAVNQINHVNIFAGGKIGTGCARLLQRQKDLGGQLHGVIHIGNVFAGDDHRHQFGQGSRENSHIRVQLGNHRAGRKINQNRVIGVKILRIHRFYRASAHRNERLGIGGAFCPIGHGRFGIVGRGGRRGGRGIVWPGMRRVGGNRAVIGTRAGSLDNNKNHN